MYLIFEGGNKMIKSIELDNFKAFKESGRVGLEKINIFVGPNSSGKSSFIKALLALRNTVNSNDDETVLDLNESIGNFKSIIFKNKIKEKIRIRINLNEINNEKINDGMIGTEATLKIMNILRSKSKDFESEVFSYLSNLGRNNNFKKVVFFEFYIKLTKSERIVVEEFNMKYTNGEIIHINMLRNSYYMYYDEKLIAGANIIKPYKFLFKVNPDKINDELDKEELKKIILFEYSIRYVEKQLREFTINMRHIDPVRNRVKRVEYVTNLKFNNTVGHMGENTITTLVGLEKNFKEDSIVSDMKENINKWIDEFDLGKSISIKKLGNDNYSLYVKNKNTGLDCNILDMGVGTSQLLPIIIESVNSPNNSVLIIEEPESHIHPNAQSKLADLFVDIVTNQNKKFIIETHSIFLIVKLQILVAQKIIKSQDIGIYYFDQKENGTKVEKMEMAENGQFKKPWPSGFFDVQVQLGKLLFQSL